MPRKTARNRKLDRFQSYRPRLEWAVYLLSLLGVLVVVHLWIQQGRGFDRGCLGFTTSAAVEAAFDCEVVVQSGAGSLFGISNVVYGLAFYLVVAALTFLMAMRSDGRARLKRLRAFVIGAGFAYTAYLVFVQTVQLGQFCALCLISGAVVTTLFALQMFDLFRPPSTPTAESSSARKPVATFAALAVAALVLAGADTVYFSQLPDVPIDVASAENRGAEGAREASVQQGCAYNPELSPIRNWREFVSFTDPSRGNPEAPVTMIVYFDPNCPHCRTLDPIVDDVIEDYHDQAHFVFKPFPLWQHSVVQVQALYAAAQEGKFFEMMQRQFELQNPNGLSLEQLKSVASEIGMNPTAMESRIMAGIYDNMITSDRQRAVDAGVRGMPAVVINGRFVAGTSRSEACLGALIERASGS